MNEAKEWMRILEEERKEAAAWRAKARDKGESAREWKDKYTRLSAWTAEQLDEKDALRKEICRISKLARHYAAFALDVDPDAAGVVEEMRRIHEDN